jgi:hypothetical protein
MRAANVPMRAALSLPFAIPLSGNLMLISYTGRKSGRPAVGYVTLAPSSSTLVSNPM